MKSWRSKLGWGLAIVYGGVFLTAYVDYRRNVGTWMADLGLDVLALPYILIGRVLTQDATFELHGFEPGGLVLGALFCMVLTYAIGFALERLFRLMVRSWIKRR